jgi:hypothetical protein
VGVSKPALGDECLDIFLGIFEGPSVTKGDSKGDNVIDVNTARKVLQDMFHSTAGKVLLPKFKKQHLLKLKKLHSANASGSDIPLMLIVDLLVDVCSEISKSLMGKAEDKVNKILA